jgi:ATP-dependent RNA helicase SUPV3L1/SUV3
MSTLRGAGACTMGSLPKRAAVVAFSLQRVYELAERLRQRRGGVAVVIGALSPRARNAQVAMYQAGEVDVMVATDAIGMGLNLDLDHVAFADLRKYDGRVARDLDPSELAQIAGRAGRYVKDGTFGTLAPLGPLSPALTDLLEQHRTVPVRRLVWRNADLDFSSTEALARSLKAEPPRKLLRRIDRAEDHDALGALVADEAVRKRAVGEEAVRLLWEVCSIPDYRQLLFEDHARLLARIYGELAGPRGKLDDAWIGAELARIEQSPRDLETLMDRVAEIRLWNYVAHQPRWLDDAEAIQERARQVEDTLSDALHDALVARFVEVRSKSRAIPPAPRSSQGGRAPAPAARGSDRGDASARPASPFAALEALRKNLPRQPGAAPDTPSPRSIDALVEAIVEAPHEAIAVDARGVIAVDGQAVGRLASGRELASPEVLVTLELDAGARLRVARRLTAFGRDLVAELLDPLRALPPLSSWGRGLVHLIERRLGTVLASEASAQLAGLEPADRAALERAGVVLGHAVVYLPDLLKPYAIARRAALASAYLGVRASVSWPRGNEVSGAPQRGVDETLYGVVGYPVVAGRAIRADLLERSVRRLAREPDVRDDKLGGWLACSAREAALVRESLGAAIALARVEHERTTPSGDGDLPSP